MSHEAVMKDLFIQTVRLTNEFRNEHVRRLRVYAASIKLQRYQQELLDNMNDAVRRNIHVEIDEAASVLSDALYD